MNKPYSESVYVLDSRIQKDVFVEYEGQNYTYRDLCLTARNGECPGNKHVHLLSDFYQHGLNLTYPTVRMGTV